MGQVPPGVTVVQTGDLGAERWLRFRPVAGGVYTNLTTYENLKVQDPDIVYQRQEPHWILPEVLAGGTLAMRAQRELFLPPFPREQKTDYDIRLAAAVCPPYYLRLERMLVGMLTRKPVVLSDVNDLMLDHMQDVDMMGSNLDVFLRKVAQLDIRFGHVGTLVDMPRSDEKPRGDKGGNTPVTEFLRPYWVPYSARQILGGRYDIVGGQKKLVLLRLLETPIVAHGDYGYEVVQQVRVLRPGSYQLFRKQESTASEWKELTDGETPTYIDEIPFAVAYANQIQDLESRPPLEDAAHLNAQAYRCLSDQDTILRVAAVPRYNLFGVPAEVEEVESGPNSATAWPVDARAEFAEPVGTSYQYRFEQIDRIEKQIAELGMSQVMGQNYTNASAEARHIDRSQGDSPLQSVALGLQNMVNECLRYHGLLMNTQDYGSCEINKDFVAARLDPAIVQQMIQLEANGKITQETLLRVLQGGEWMPDGFDLATEIEDTATARAQALADRQAQLDASFDGLP
jgi:hypothetical protein